ncbi:hypothetical protein BDY19DRAFT_904935 [Irpex rosettiformis]|uniref:Uncharacterized protein n=1 Tax=Irpex rosettiformis TaxID=378272 RepID=A0ACB8U916_9APHY|nr:hypothetical protein BDY19DRAFT_904935 [Irpex rosettiformis]
MQLVVGAWVVAQLRAKGTNANSSLEAAIALTGGRVNITKVCMFHRQGHGHKSLAMIQSILSSQTRRQVNRVKLLKHKARRLRCALSPFSGRRMSGVRHCSDNKFDTNVRGLFVPSYISQPPATLQKIDF